MQEHNKFIETQINSTFHQLKNNLNNDQAEIIKQNLIKKLNNNNIKRLYELLLKIPRNANSKWTINKGALCIKTAKEISAKHYTQLFKKFNPWRKGPFKINDINIETEWRSYLKINRLLKHVSFENKTVLDIGCGSGYFLYQLKHNQAKTVIGIDPFELFYFQYLILNQLTHETHIHFLPIKWQESHCFKANNFDVVMCMGVLYHQKRPTELLNQIYQLLKENGVFVLETLIAENKSLIPEGRYANMRNVYIIPSIDQIKTWITNIGFKSITCINQSQTTQYEQKKTPWSPNYSLIESLDQKNNNLTVEGHPRPKRAIFIIKK